MHDDDFTMVMPKATMNASRGGFVPTHKRSGLGQAMSVDSGIPHMIEDEGFTMVIPDLSNQQQRARSPLAYRSPLKAMFEEAREMVESFEPKREAQSGSTVVEDVAATPRSGSPSKAPPAEEVQIYEDPFIADDADALSNGERKVLGELPVNENVRLQSPTQSSGAGDSPRSPHNISEARSPAIASPADRAEVLRNRKLLGSGIDRIRGKTLDAHGFRRVQDLVKCELDIWDGGKRYDELMSVLVEYLQTFDEDPKMAQLTVAKAMGLKAQALAVARALLHLHKKRAVGWHAKALIAFLACRRGTEANSHVVTDIEKAADEIVKTAEPTVCIDAIMEFLPSIGRNKGAGRSTSMALVLLRQLLDSAKQSGFDLGAERKVRLVQTTAKYLDDGDAEVRKADVELASELFELFGSSKAEFWSEFKGTDEGRLGLLTYYIARRGKARA